MTRLALAVSEHTVTVIWLHAGVTQMAEVPRTGELSSDIRALANRAPAAETATVTLFRPLAHCLIVPLPRMSPANVQRVLSRDASRHVGTLAGVQSSVSTQWINNNRYVAAFSADGLLAEIEGVAADHGWKYLEIRAVDDAIASAAMPSHGETANPVVVVCSQTGPTHIVHVEKGMPVLGRTLPSGADAANIRAFIDMAMPDRETGNLPAVTIIGSAAGSAPVAAAMGKEGYRTRSVDARLPANATPAAIIASLALGGAARLPLRSHAAQQRRKQQFRRLTLALTAAAILAAVVGFSVAGRGIRRRLAEVDQQRADISAPVANALAERSRVDHLTAMIGALAEHERSPSRITNVLSVLGIALPQGTSITTFAANGDTLTIEGESDHGASVYEALRKTPALAGLKPAAPLRRERGPGDTMIEKFAYTAQLRANPAASTP